MQTLATFRPASNIASQCPHVQNFHIELSIRNAGLPISTLCRYPSTATLLFQATENARAKACSFLHDVALSCQTTASQVKRTKPQMLHGPTARFRLQENAGQKTGKVPTFPAIKFQCWTTRPMVGLAFAGGWLR